LIRLGDSLMRRAGVRRNGVSTLGEYLSIFPETVILISSVILVISCSACYSIMDYKGLFSPFWRGMYTAVSLCRPLTPRQPQRTHHTLPNNPPATPGWIPPQLGMGSRKTHHINVRSIRLPYPCILRYGNLCYQRHDALHRAYGCGTTDTRR
jgi:hypothetical protein